MAIDKPNQRTFRIYDYIVRYKRAHDGNSPSYEQIGESVNAVKSSIHDHIRMLEQMGKITVEEGKGKAITVLGGVWRLEDK